MRELIFLLSGPNIKQAELSITAAFLLMSTRHVTPSADVSKDY